MAKKIKRNSLSEIAAQKAEFEARLEADKFGRACRREHEALRGLLIMLSHIKGMPTIPEVVAEADAAVVAVSNILANNRKPETVGLWSLP